jgi:hypothetical protein
MRGTMLSAALSVLSLGVLSALISRAADPEQPSAEALIKQLGSGDFAEREKAAQLLKARGPAVLPALRKAADHPDAEVRRQVTELIPLLEAVAALSPKRITLKVDRRPLSAVLDEIEKQSRYKLVYDGSEEDNRISFEVKDVPFWEALEQVRRQTGLAVSIQPFKDGIQLKRRQTRSAIVTVEGSFRLEAKQFHEDRDLDFTEPGADKEPGRREHLLTLTVSVLAEPKFILLKADRPRVEVALDEDGKSLTAVTPEKRKVDESDMLRANDLRDLFNKDFQHTADIHLRRSTDAAKRIKELRGDIPVKVVVERKLVVVSDKVLDSKGTKCKVGGDTLEIVRAEQDEGGGVDINIAIPPDRNGVEMHHWNKRVHLEDDKGNRFESSGGGHSISGEMREVIVHYRAPKDSKLGPPTKLIIEDWVILDHRVPFAFKDVPLP